MRFDSAQNYFGCFFSLPIVISSLRWGVAAGRKTMVVTATLLFVLSGPVKSLTYLLMHGLVGVTMGSLWRLEANWSLSIFLCTFVRGMGAMGYVLVSSFLIRENILALITVCFSHIYSYSLRHQYNSINGNDICHFWNSEEKGEKMAEELANVRQQLEELVTVREQLQKITKVQEMMLAQQQQPPPWFYHY